jgi:hypothetical protein
LCITLVILQFHLKVPQCNNKTTHLTCVHLVFNIADQFEVARYNVCTPGI